tara:strand:- start:176 stop:826 length:651 start_codon:yes stop_codon:yes gene_type:complete
MKNNKIKYNNLNQVFDSIPSSIRYVVLRNYTTILNNTFDDSSDIDILTDNAYNFASIINAKKCHFSNFRSRYSIMVNNNRIFLDIREASDNYYYINWQNNILDSRIKEKFLFIPNRENYYYSLLYHMLIHKKQISDNYVEILCNAEGYSWSKDYARSDWIDILEKYLSSNAFFVVVPNDYSVIFNHNDMKYIKQSFYNRTIRFFWVLCTGIKNRYV